MAKKKRGSKNGWKKEIKVSQNYICAVCGKPGTDRTLNIHHCINKSRGGNNSPKNCVAVHEYPCHKWIHKTFGNNYYDPRDHKKV